MARASSLSCPAAASRCPACSVLGLTPLLTTITAFQSGRTGRDWSPSDGNLAAQHGLLSLMQERLDLGRPFVFTEDALDQAAARNDLSTVRWLNEKASVPCTSQACNAAAAQGFLEMVRYLTEQV